MAQIIAIGLSEYQQMAKEKQVQLIDVREPDEYASENIQEAVNIPLSVFNPQIIESTINDKILVFHCLSGIRTKNNASLFATIKIDKAYILDGGLNAWKQAGLPTRKLSQ